MRRSDFIIFFLLVVYNSTAQNVFDKENILRFADNLYNNREYQFAIHEYRHALFLENCDNTCRIRLFNSYFITSQYGSGINIYKSIYPDGLSDNDTLEMIYGKMLLLNGDWATATKLINNSRSLNSNQHSFLKLSNELFSENWDNLTAKKSGSLAVINDHGYAPVIDEIKNLKYKKAELSLLLSTFIPGSGKMYCGYWQDGFIALSTIGITAWQAGRGFRLNGSRSAYGWIFASLSGSFYISNLFGSYKAAGMKNYHQRLKIKNEVKRIFDNSYNY